MADFADSGDPSVGKTYNTVRDIKCPRCGKEMEKTSDPKQKHIWYEICHDHGIFMDAGEFTDFKFESLFDRFRALIKGDRNTVAPWAQSPVEQGARRPLLSLGKPGAAESARRIPLSVAVGATRLLHVSVVLLEDIDHFFLGWRFRRDFVPELDRSCLHCFPFLVGYRG